MRNTTGTYIVFNTASQNLIGTPDWRADVVVTSPPYNLGHDAADVQSHRGFMRGLAQTLSACTKIMKPDGHLIVDVATELDTKDKGRIKFSNEIKKICEESGTLLTQKFDYLMQGHEADDADHGHSPRQDILVFMRRFAKKTLFDATPLKPAYKFGEGEGEIFWPDALVKDMFQTFELNGKNVFDPYAGSGTIGAMVAESGGAFMGCEVSEDFYKRYHRPRLCIGNSLRL